MLIKALFSLILYLTLTQANYNEAKVETITDYDDDSTTADEDRKLLLPDSTTPVEGANKAEGRLLWSYPQNPIIDLVMKSPGINYVSENFKDPFDFLRDTYDLPNNQKSPYKEYDFVIIGAGSAGSTLASRLSSGGWADILLLEAGKPEMLLTDIPALAPYFQLTDYTWQYYMEPQPGVCMGMLNERCFWPRGKAVGGTSVINYMIYTRGRPQDWDRIAADGNYGWSYDDVLKYYIRSENAKLKGFDHNPYRGRNGELPVEFTPIRTKLIEAFLEAGRAYGHPTVDYNAPDGFGFGYVQTTTSNGRRCSAAKAFLHNHKKRKSLHILPESRATKILIDSETKRAYGVEFVRNRIKYTVKARKEVILSAGPIASPQLLMLSGVGPKNHLNTHGIPVIKDLPVGKVLYDHICFPGVIFSLNATNVSFIENKALNIRYAFEWLQYGTGPFTTPGGVEGIGYIKTSVSNDAELVPDVEFISIGGSILSDGGPSSSNAARKGMRINERILKEGFGAIDNTNTWSAFIMPLHPKSRGYIELKNNNPFSFPKMVGNYLTHPQDVATFIAAIRHLIELGSSPAFQKIGAKLHRAEYSTCREHEFNSDGYWECAVRTFTATLHHQVASCRMGPHNDPEAVVDPELRVYGIEGLRVVDSSVIPRPIAAHTHAPAVMIGEKAADMIKSTWTFK